MENTIEVEVGNGNEVASDFLSKIFEIDKKLFNLMGYFIETKDLFELLRGWYIATVRYENHSEINFIKERDYLTGLVRDLEKGLSALQAIRDMDMREISPFYEVGSADYEIFLFTRRISMVKAVIDFSQLSINYFFNRNYIKRQEIFKIFDYAKSLGLKPRRESGAGAGNKDPFWEFVKIITELEDRKALRRYYGLYEKEPKALQPPQDPQWLDMPSIINSLTKQ
jgi:hypothetical protein